MAKPTQSKASAPHYRATRTETFARGDKNIELVAGAVYDDLPEDLIEELSGDYGGLELVPEGTLEVEQEDGTWKAVEEEEVPDA